MDGWISSGSQFFAGLKIRVLYIYSREIRPSELLIKSSLGETLSAGYIRTAVLMRPFESKSFLARKSFCPVWARLKEVEFKIQNGLLINNHHPSTILDCTSEQIRVVRRGAFDIEVLEGIAGQVFKKD